MSTALLKYILGLLVLAMTLLACSGSSDKADSPEGAATSTAGIHGTGCSVTLPNGQGPPGERPSPYHHGGDGLWTGLWPDGVVEFVPDGPGALLEDGSLSMKFWWRGVPGPLEITGRRLDSSSPPLRADIPEGYGDSGFQASGLIFSSPGCWEVTGRVGDAELTFVTLVKSGYTTG